MCRSIYRAGEVHAFARWRMARAIHALIRSSPARTNPMAAHVRSTASACSPSPASTHRFSICLHLPTSLSIVPRPDRGRKHRFAPTRSVWRPPPGGIGRAAGDARRNCCLSARRFWRPSRALSVRAANESWKSPCAIRCGRSPRDYRTRRLRFPHAEERRPAVTVVKDLRARAAWSVIYALPEEICAPTCRPLYSAARRKRQHPAKVKGHE